MRFDDWVLSYAIVGTAIASVAFALQHDNHVQEVGELECKLKTNAENVKYSREVDGCVVVID
jgi:hypothetical protein